MNRSKIDTSKLRKSLQALEDSYKQAAATRADIVADWGEQDSPQKRAEMSRLQRRLARDVAQHKQNIQQAFVESQQQAEQGRADAYRLFTQSQVATDYRSALGAYAPLMAVMSQDVIVAKLQQAVAAGVTGEVRALVELADMFVPAQKQTGVLLSQLKAVKEAGQHLTPVEQAAERDVVDLGKVTGEYGRLIGFADRRAEEIVIEGRDDWRSGWYAPENIFNPKPEVDQGAEQQPNALFEYMNSRSAEGVESDDAGTDSTV